jgi:hypothetical protein
MAPFADVIIYPSWQARYFSALRELDPHELKTKIAAVHEALSRRNTELNTTGDNRERMAMREAARQLRSLRVSVFGYPSVSAEESDPRLVEWEKTARIAQEDKKVRTITCLHEAAHVVYVERARACDVSQRARQTPLRRRR